MTDYNVIFHISEEEKWKTVIINAENLLNDLGKDVSDIIILVNGKAVLAYAKEDKQLENKRVEGLLEKGVRFFACKNALRGNKLTETALKTYVKVVPAGVSELVKRQNEGYAYIKP